MRCVSASAFATMVLLVVAATLLVASPASAASDGDFNYTASGSTATITSYSGSDTEVVIPDTVTDGTTTYTVTAIGDLAFAYGSLTSVTIPDSVTAIGYEAFFYNTSLHTVIIGDSVTTIGYEAFSDNYNLTSVTIPDSVTTISDYAFFNNTSLTTIVLGNSVTTIGTSAFALSALTSITIPDSVVTIGLGAFESSALTSVTIGDSLTTISNYAFNDNALTTVTIPDSVTTIADGAFANNPLTGMTFAGNAPSTFTAASTTGSLGTGAGLTVYYYSGATGFTTPLWNGYTTGAVSPSESDLAITSAGPVPADGTTAFTATATIRDELHAPLAGTAVAFTIPTGVTTSATECTTAADGTCSITLTSATVGTYPIAAAINGTAIADSPQDVTFTAIPADPGTSTIAITPVTINADGTDNATITVALYDAAGTALTSSRGTVAITTTLGTLSAVTDNSNGTYTATLTAATAGTGTISFTINGTPATATTNVTALTSARAVILTPRTETTTPILASTGLDTTTPLALDGGILTLGIALLALPLTRRRKTS